MQKSVPDIDVLGKLIEIGASAAPVTPNAPAALISVDMDWSRERAIVPASTPKITRQQREEEQQRQDEARSRMINAALNGGF